MFRLLIVSILSVFLSAPVLAVQLTAPILETATTATVTGINVNASDLSLYADISDGNGPVLMTNGHQTFTPGAAPSSYQFTGLTFLRGWKITAKETVSSVLGPASNEVTVAVNGQVRISLAVRKLSAGSGPVGANGGTPACANNGTPSGCLITIGAERDSSGTPAPGGKIVLPSSNWQEIPFATSIAGGTDVVHSYVNSTAIALDGPAHPWYVLESLLISCDSAYRGPYKLYIDNIENDGVVLGGFEDVTLPSANDTVMFRKPSFSGTTSGKLFCTGNPPGCANVSQVVSEVNGYETGLNGLVAQWQWLDSGSLTLANAYLRYTTSNAASKANPMVRLDRPVRVRFMLVPIAGLTGGPTINTQPQNQIACVDGGATFTVAATASSGGGSLHYQWYKSNPLAPAPYNAVPGLKVGSDSPTLTLNGLLASDNGTKVAVNVYDANGNTASTTATLSFVTITGQPTPSTQSQCPGGSASITVTASGGGSLSYQWYRGVTQLSNAGHYSNVDTPTLTISPIDSGDAATDYKCVVSSCGASVTSSTATLTLSVAGCPRTVSAWRSVRSHGGGAGNLAIALDPAASGNGPAGPTVETRDVGIQRIEVDLNGGALTLADSAGVTVVGYTTVDGVMGSQTSYTPASVSMMDADTLAITFHVNPESGFLPDQTCYTISIGPSTFFPEALSGDVDCYIRALVGDTTGSGLENLSDVLFTDTKADAVTPATAAALHDVNLSGGNIDSSDSLLIKSKVSTPAKQALCP